MWGESPRFVKIPLVINIISETSCALPLRHRPHKLVSEQENPARAVRLALFAPHFSIGVCIWFGANEATAAG